MKKAFTLAEVLITLTIIGVIAALTIPNLMLKYERHVYSVKIKKFVALLANNISYVMKENGCTDLECTVKSNDVYGFNKRQAVLKLFFKEVKENDKSCSYNVTDVKYLDGTKPTSVCAFGGCIDHATSACVDGKIGITQANENFVGGYGWYCDGAHPKATCAKLLVFLDGKSKKPVAGKNVFAVPINADGGIQSSSTKITKEEAKKDPQKALFYLRQNNWQMDYLD